MGDGADERARSKPIEKCEEVDDRRFGGDHRGRADELNIEAIDFGHNAAARHLLQRAAFCRLASEDGVTDGPKGEIGVERDA
jgi:hypothetical protein